MSIGYRAVLNLSDSEDAIRRSTEQFRSWLKSKYDKGGIPEYEWSGTGIKRLGPRSTLTVVEPENDQSGIRRLLLKLEDQNSEGVWTVSVYAISDKTRPSGQRETVIIEASLAGVPQDIAAKRLRLPRFVKLLLGTVEGHEGDAQIGAKPVWVRANDVNRLVDVILDQNRQIPVVVASALDYETERKWAGIVEQLVSESLGNAAVYVISAGAVDQFNELMGWTHDVRAGAIRTFLANVEPETDGDGTRHRYIGPRTLAENITQGKVSRRLKGLVARELRNDYLRRDVPAFLRRDLHILTARETDISIAFQVDEIVERIEEQDRMLTEVPVVADRGHENLEDSEDLRTSVGADLDALVAKEPRVGENTGGEPSLSVRNLPWYRRLFDFIKQRVSNVDEEETTLVVAVQDVIVRNETHIKVQGKKIDEAGEAIQNLSEEMKDLRDENDNLQLEATQAVKDRMDLQRTVDYYSRKLREMGRWEMLSVPDEEEDWKPIDSYPELLAIISGGGDSSHPLRNYLRFTGDEDALLELSVKDPLGKYTVQIWDRLRVLHDYGKAKAQGFVGGMYDYLASDYDGHKCAKTQYAPKESDTVRNQWAAERTFPVPPDVDSTGFIFMESHLKISGGDRFVPRIHFYDDTNGTGKIYVGYIGRHLTNTRTN